ncbi:MAG: DUF86 domain-containing protein [Anaerolineales bacterium]|nr:MAG: DUF86 domain-containing protein [Anaerolineales bacterium]
MSRDDTYLVDILESAKIALDYVFGKTWDQFYEDIQCQDAVVRRIEIIGEAARRVSEGTRNQHPQIPWREMTSMRNLVVHEYDVVDINQVWDTVQNKLPPLIKELAKIVPPE